jgi:hypothetical protein
MPRNQEQPRRKPRHDAERDAAQAIAGQPRDGDDDELQQPENVPSFLTARELQARDPAKANAAPADDGADDDEDEDDQGTTAGGSAKPTRKKR